MAVYDEGYIFTREAEDLYIELKAMMYSIFNAAIEKGLRFEDIHCITNMCVNDLLTTMVADKSIEFLSSKLRNNFTEDKYV